MDKKAEIKRCGKELFNSKGFKDTNVSDITKLAGMATGTFYIYYSSKDQLFMELYIEENAILKKNIMGSIDLEAEPLQIIKDILKLNYEGMYANPILKEWYNRESFSKIEQNFRKANGLEQIDFVYDTFVEVVKSWQEKGKMRTDIDARMIMAMFSAIVNVEMHKEEIGFQYFPEVVEYLTEFIMKGLMASTDAGNVLKP